MKYVLSALIFAAGMFVYWCFGNNFERGSPLGAALVVVGYLASYPIIFYKK